MIDCYKIEDTFGAKDEDWGIYREIVGYYERRSIFRCASIDLSGSKSRQEESDEDEDLTELSKLDEVLMTYDPGFVPDNPLEEGRPFKETILFRLAHGPSRTDLTDPAVQNQIHLNVERIRVPEVFFQPSIVGLDQAGIVECFADILKHYDPAWRNRMAQVGLIYIKRWVGLVSNASLYVEHSRNGREYAIPELCGAT